jgi:hypothetical protein
MIPFKIRQKRTRLLDYLHKRRILLEGTMPNSFDDVTMAQFARLRETDSVWEQIYILTGIHPNSWKSIVNQEQILYWLTWLDWSTLDKLEKPEHVLINWKLIPTQIDIGKDTFAQKIIAQRKLQECKTQDEQIKMIPEIVAIYLQPHIHNTSFNPDKVQDALIEVLKMSVATIVPLGDFYIKDMLRIIEREQKTLKYTPDRKELLAGVQDLNKFGEKNLVDALAGGDVLKHDDVLKLPYNTVYLKLYQDNVKARINKKYATIK